VKDKDLNLEDIEFTHTLGGSGGNSCPGEREGEGVNMILCCRSIH
jgi:hypothetical protein